MIAMSLKRKYMDLEKYLKIEASLINKSLKKFLPKDNSLISKAMRYSVFAGGKRLRPILVLMGAEACGVKNLKQILPSACAVELIHTYSLIHDDLPAMDNDDLRRGLPTSHKKFGEAAAILAGDALLTFSFGLLAGFSPKLSRSSPKGFFGQVFGPKGEVVRFRKSKVKTLSPL